MASRTPSRSVSSASLPLDASMTEKPGDDAATAQKTAQIMAACHDSDLAALVNLAASTHGLVSDSLRRTAWPILLGCSNGNSNSNGDGNSDAKTEPPWPSLSPHRDEEQVAKDVNRAFVSYPKESERQLDKRKEELSNVIVEVLRRHPSLCYFQGYHDIVQVLYLVLGAQDAPTAVTRLSLLRIRDFMLPSLDPAICHLELLPAIIRSEDRKLYDYLPKIQPNYALGATLTLFSHVIEAYGDITRLFDFFLASDTVVPVYFFASIILSRREELMEIEDDEDEAIFYVMLGKLPQPFHLQSRIEHTIDLYRRLPPQSLRSWAWWRVSASSVLKATPTPFHISALTLEEGQTLFSKQAREVRIKQAYDKAALSARRFRFQMWQYRRPGTVGLAIVVGIYALWLGRYGGINGGRLTNYSTYGEILKRIMSGFVR